MKSQQSASDASLSLCNKDSDLLQEPLQDRSSHHYFHKTMNSQFKFLLETNWSILNLRNVLQSVTVVIYSTIICQLKKHAEEIFIKIHLYFRIKTSQVKIKFNENSLGRTQPSTILNAGYIHALQLLF